MTASSKYFVGQALTFRWEQAWRGEEAVTVVELRSRGGALLSNGWCVDADGLAEGTKRIPGGTVHEVAPSRGSLRHPFEPFEYTERS